MAKCKLILTESISYENGIPLETPINGPQKIRSDIQSKKGLINLSRVQSSKNEVTPSATIISVFNKDMSGKFLKINTTLSKEGGESANPMTILSESFIGE